MKNARTARMLTTIINPSKCLMFKAIFPLQTIFILILFPKSIFPWKKIQLLDRHEWLPTAIQLSFCFFLMQPCLKKTLIWILKIKDLSSRIDYVKVFWMGYSLIRNSATVHCFKNINLLQNYQLHKGKLVSKCWIISHSKYIIEWDQN